MVAHEEGRMQIYRVLRESLPSLALPNLHEEISEDVMKELGRLHQLADATELALSFVSKSTLSRQKLYEKLRRKNILARTLLFNRRTRTKSRRIKLNNK